MWHIHTHTSYTNTYSSIKMLAISSIKCKSQIRFDEVSKQISTVCVYFDFLRDEWPFHFSVLQQRVKMRMENDCLHKFWTLFLVQKVYKNLNLHIMTPLTYFNFFLFFYAHVKHLPVLTFYVLSEHTDFDPQTVRPGSRYSHVQEVQERLNFLRYLQATFL